MYCKLFGPLIQVGRTKKEDKKVEELKHFDKINIEKEMVNDLKPIEGTKKMENDKDVIRYTKDIEDKNMEISTLKQELETMRKTYEVQLSQLEAKAEAEKKVDDKEIIKYVKELEDKNMEVLTLKKNLETMKSYFYVRRDTIQHILKNRFLL